MLVAVALSSGRGGVVGTGSGERGLRARVDKIGHARIKYVGKYQSFVV